MHTLCRKYDIKNGIKFTINIVLMKIIMIILCILLVVLVNLITYLSK